MANRKKVRNASACAVLIAVLTLATWGAIAYGIQQFVQLASDEFYLHANAAPDWATQVAKIYLFSPVVLLWYMPTVAALAVFASLVRRRPTTVTLRAIFAGLTIACMVMAFIVQASKSFYSAFPVFVIVHTSLSFGLTVWLVRELRMLLEALAKTNGD